MNPFKKIPFFLISSLVVATAGAEPLFPCCLTDEHPVGRPNGHASISVMGDHTHGEGGWMLSYRYMNMQMDGMRRGTNRVSTAGVLTDGFFTVAPESMTMEMHMLGLMHAPTDRLTLALMANVTETEMKHSVRALPPLVAAIGDDVFTTRSNGLGDLRLTALYRFYLEENRRAHFGLGLSLPTGSISEKDRTPRPGMPPSFNRNQLPAAMQLGSGTFDLLPSITFVQQNEDWSLGVQANAVIRLESENTNDYRLGHQFELVGWAGYNLTPWLGLNAGFSYQYTGKLKGTQEGVGTNGPMPGLRSVATAFGENYGGERIDLLLGLNLLQSKGFLEGHRLALDVRLPLWQDLNGYQLETDSMVTIGWQKAF